MDYSFETINNTVIITYYNKLKSDIIIKSLSQLYKDEFYNKKRRVLFDLTKDLSIQLELKELLDIREYVIANRGDRTKGHVAICLRNTVVGRLSFVLEMIMAKIDITFKIGAEKEKLLQWIEAVK